MSSEVIVRYVCDDCGSYTKDPEGFVTVEERFYRGGRSGAPFETDSRRSLYCPNCFRKKETGSYGGRYSVDSPFPQGTK